MALLVLMGLLGLAVPAWAPVPEPVEVSRHEQWHAGVAWETPDLPPACAESVVRLGDADTVTCEPGQYIGDVIDSERGIFLVCVCTCDYGSE